MAATTNSAPTPGCGQCAPHPAMRQLLASHRIAEGPRRPSGPSTPTGGPAQRGRRHAPHADQLVLGTVVTMDPAKPEVEAVAVAGGRISALGSADELDGLRGPDTEVVELGDRVAYPGFIEPHMHLWATALFDSFIDCSAYTCATFDQVVERLTAGAGRAAPGAWVTGRSFDPSLYPGEPDLTAAILDRIAPDNPVLVMNASMHFAYVSSRALTLAGITTTTPDPAGGSYHRAVDGRLTGVISELSAIMPVVSVLPQVSQDDLAGHLVAIMTRAASAGVTKVHEAGTGALLGAAEFDLLHHLSTAGRLPTRVSTAMLSTARPALEAAGLQPGTGDDWVRAVSWKVIADGSNQGRSGYLRQPYLGTDQRGAPNLTPDELAEEIRYGHQHGWQVMVHANGDAAIDMVVAAYEAVLQSGAPNDRRHRIEHCSLAEDQHFARMAALGLSPSFLIDHVAHWGRTFRDNILGPERADRLDSFATALRHGLRPTLHSDYSVSPIDPLRAVQAAVTRVMRDGGGVLNPAERVDVDAALRAVTIDAAWQIHADDVIGSLEVGKYADLAVLSADPRHVDPEAIADIAVHQTRVAGATTWSSEG